MRQTTVRITETAHALLKKFARDEARPMHAVLEEALEEHRRRRFLESINSGYAALRRDREGWPAEVAERGDWDSALLDGLGRAPSPSAARRSPRSRKPKKRP
jgi:hypothetical protein